MTHPVDVHQKATAYARQETVNKYGPNSVPVTPGSEEHAYWLQQYDSSVRSQQLLDDVTLPEIWTLTRTDDTGEHWSSNKGGHRVVYRTIRRTVDIIGTAQ